MEVHGLLLTVELGIAALIGFGVLIWSVYRMERKMNTDDAAIFLEARRIDEVLREMRAELRK